MPLYIADYEADTAHLSPEEDGIYTRLLRLCWRTPGCSIPDDAAWIARMMRVTPEYHAEKVVPVLSEFFRRRKARLFSPRQQEIFEKINSVSKARSLAGRNGGRPRKQLTDNDKHESKSKANGNHLEPEPEPEQKRETNVSLPRKRGNPKTHTSPDARISEQMRAVAIGRGLSDAEAEAQFAKFRDRALAKGDAYADWNAAWRNWLTSPYYAPVLGAVVPLNPEKADGRPSRSDQRLDAFLRGAAG